MKIILINYRYYISGGPERYMFNIKEILEKNGHEVIPFSVKHNQNIPSKYDDYFLDPIGSGDEIYGHEYKRDIRTIIQVFGRMVYSLEAKIKLKRLITDQKPDLIYILQFQNKISCSVIDIAYKLDIPIVQRISDFSHICIDAILYQYQKKEICEKCLHGSKINGVIHKCANNSFLTSAIKVFALKIHDILKTREKITSFIIPASFTVSKFIEFGIPKEKIFHIPTFFNFKNEDIENIEYQDYFLYVGRIDPDKGLFTLIKAFENTKYKLIVVGYSIEGYDSNLKEYLINKKHNITFTGKLEFSKIIPLFEKCLCTICPSEWYDNFPNSVLESYAFRKPVIASDLGSLKELVIKHKTGIHFEPKNHISLRKAVDFMYNNKNEVIKMGENGYKSLKNDFSQKLHYEKLMQVFDNAIRKNK
jgi:glycosyltransferase involved in cell wall biosynthesis